MRQDLLSNELFGNEAGEDEDIEILNSYFVEKLEFRNFYSKNNKFFIVRSRKGVGKSALLRKTYYQYSENNDDNISLYLKGSDLVSMNPLTSMSPNVILNSWQQRICSRINYEIGGKIGFAKNDISISLVESSELAGFKDRNIISALTDRLRVKLKDIDLRGEKLSIENAKAVLERYSKKHPMKVWLFIDDIDATFINSNEERLSLSTFFTACRYLVNHVKGLYIRSSVRTDVWTILKQHDEALDKCSQYLFDLHWSTGETGKILERKIISYFKREYPYEKQYMNLKEDEDTDKIYRLVFTSKFRWAQRQMDPYQPIHILSNARPRWATQLCKMAGLSAFKRGSDVININDIANNLRDFGQARLDDLYREHRHQCPKIENLVEIFSNGRRRYSTKELLKIITDKVVRKNGLPEIDGFHSVNSAMDVAHFLFRIGFIYARDECASTGLEFIKFEDRPNLLTTNINPDDKMAWEIHPSFRSVLKIQKNKEIVSCKA